jgi:hypothetical protein
MIKPLLLLFAARTPSGNSFGLGAAADDGVSILCTSTAPVSFDAGLALPPPPMMLQLLTLLPLLPLLLALLHG